MKSDKNTQVEAMNGKNDPSGTEKSAESTPALQQEKPSLDEMKRRSLEIVGKYKSGFDDVSINHDEYLEAIYGDFGT